MISLSHHFGLDAKTRVLKPEIKNLAVDGLVDNDVFDEDLLNPKVEFVDKKQKEMEFQLKMKEMKNEVHEKEIQAQERKKKIFQNIFL